MDVLPHDKRGSALLTCSSVELELAEMPSGSHPDKFLCICHPFDFTLTILLCGAMHNASWPHAARHQTIDVALSSL